MWSIGYATLFVASTTLPLVYCHHTQHGWNWSQAVLVLFSAINFMICCWELSLFYFRHLVKSQYTSMARKLPQGCLPQPMFLFQDVPMREALGLKHWAQVWSTYSLMDPSYSDQTTFGFIIDAGNGHVTLVPTILFALCLTWDLVPARLMGIIGIIMHYQELYGTVMYFFSYFLNGRWRGRPGLPVVLVANTIWILGPALGMHVCYQFIMEGTYTAVRL